MEAKKPHTPGCFGAYCDSSTGTLKRNWQGEMLCESCASHDERTKMTQPDEKTTCPKCGTNQRAKYTERGDDGSEMPAVVWTCKSRQVGDAFIQSKHCAYENQLASLKAQLAEATATFTTPDGEVWSPPTAEAYYRACQALKSRRSELTAATQEAERLKQDRQQVSDAVRTAIQMLASEDVGDYHAGMLILHEIIGSQGPQLPETGRSWIEVAAEHYRKEPHA